VAQAGGEGPLRFVAVGTLEGKPFKEVIDLAVDERAKRVTGRAETFVDGASTSVMEITLRK
jgi:hypothetical protein